MKNRTRFAALFVAASIAMGGAALAAPSVQGSTSTQSQVEKSIDAHAKTVIRNLQG